MAKKNIQKYNVPYSGIEGCTYSVKKKPDGRLLVILTEPNGYQIKAKVNPPSIGKDLADSIIEAYKTCDRVYNHIHSGQGFVERNTQKMENKNPAGSMNSIYQKIFDLSKEEKKERKERKDSE